MSKPANEPGPVRPRDAASLVIHRGRGPEARILPGRRHPRHRFIPDAFVFPGGRVEASDRDRPAQSELRPAVARALGAHAGRRPARAFGIAAVRETWEETGLVIGEIRDGGIVPALDRLHFVARAITPRMSPIRFHARFLMVDAAAAHGTVQSNGELLDLAWVTVPEALALPVVDVTEFVLAEVGRRLTGTRPRGVPLFSYRHGIARVRYQER